MSINARPGRAAVCQAVKVLSPDIVCFKAGFLFFLMVFRIFLLTLLEPQSRSGDKPVKFQVVLSPNGTAVLKGLIGLQNLCLTTDFSI